MRQDRDPRYEFVKCATCQRTYQLIDFRGNQHAYLCPNNVPSADDIRRLEGEYPNVRWAMRAAVKAPR